MLIYFFLVEKADQVTGTWILNQIYEVIRKHFALVLTNLVVKACQVVRALVVVEALASQANAQGVTSVPSPAWQYFLCPFLCSTNNNIHPFNHMSPILNCIEVNLRASADGPWVPSSISSHVTLGVLSF